MVWVKDDFIIAGLTLLFTYVILTRKSEASLRKNRVKIKNKVIRFYMAFKQYGMLLIVALAITAVFILLLKLTVLE